jgi:dipeptidyl aminopeptidase/acylaminoacyl peptidase
VWTVDDLLFAERADAFSLSPDGRWVVWRLETHDADEELPAHNLWIAPLDAPGEPVQLTRGKKSANAPGFAPDGRHLAFLSDRQDPEAGKDDSTEGAQLWTLSLAGGDPRPVTALQRAVQRYAWRDAKTLVFAVQEDKAQWEHERKELKDASVSVEDEAREPPVRLFEVQLGGKPNRLTANRDRIGFLAVSPDGRWALARHDQGLRHRWDQSSPPHWMLHDLQCGTAARVLEDRRAPGRAWWSPDSSGFYFEDSFTTHPELVIAPVMRLWWYDVFERAAREIPLDWDRGLSWGGLAPLPDGFVALLADGLHMRLARFGRQGGRRPVATEHDGQIWSVVASLDGTVAVYVRSTPSDPPQAWTARLEGDSLAEPRQVTRLNAGWKDRPRRRAEAYRWSGANGDEVEGLLTYPLVYEEGRAYPLVLTIHGGPFSADMAWWRADWADPGLLFAQRGAFVLSPNYHGSSGYGLEFGESIANGRYYDLPVADLRAGVDALVAEGKVDPCRMGAMGWSNGAILTTALIVEDSRFVAASSGAGGSEWVADWGSCAFGDLFQRYYFGMTPLEDPVAFLSHNPLYRFDRVTTPTIYFHGSEDTAVPPHHGWTQWRAMQKHGKAETKFVVFPGEPHGLTKLGHKRRKLEEELAWFDRFLFRPSRPARPEAVKKASRLADALELAGAARVGAAYGRLAGDVLVPETILWKGMRIGRFEVTRAQWAAFDRAAKPAPGSENLPQGGVTFERAQAYCSWLSLIMGENVRLPSHTEAGELYSGEGGNTLDAWAGYAPNLEDAEVLRTLAAGLGEAALARPVGSEAGAPDGEAGPRAYDLRGNVAEWTTGPEGQPKLMGGSADTPAKPKDDRLTPGAAYQGLRIVVDGAAIAPR